MRYYQDVSLVESPILGKRPRQSESPVELLSSPVAAAGLTDNQNSLTVNNICASWTGDERKLVLQDITFDLNSVSTS